MIDSSVSDIPSLIADVEPNSEVLLLDGERDGITQITGFLKKFARISSLHIVSHGTSGNLLLGNTRLSFDTLDRYFEPLKSWANSLQDADLFLYGCEVAAGGMGQLFIQQLHQLTGANIAASTGIVGNTANGANWQLDARAGEVKTSIAFSQQIQNQYSGHFELDIEISLSDNTDVLIETEGTSYTLFFDISGPPPSDTGVAVILRSNIPGALGEFSILAGGVTGFFSAPVVVSATDILLRFDAEVGGELPPEGPFGATITLPTLNDFIPEGPEEIIWEILPVPDDLLIPDPDNPGELIPVPGTEGVTVNPAANTASVTIFDDPSQVPTNTDPIATGDSFSVNEDETLTVDAASGVLGNDSDIDGDTLSAALVSDVSNGTLTLNADGSFEYTPDADFNGSDSFTYAVSDGNGGTDTATVTLTVDPINDDPVAAGDSFSVDEDATLTVDAAADVLANDSDIDGDSLSAALVSDVSNGTLTLNADGSFEYTPDADFNGSDSFTYAVSDGNGGTDTATVTLTVDPVNDDPVAAGDSFSVDEDATLTVDAAAGVLANDSDIDGDSLSAALVSDVSNGTLTLNADGSFEYTPDADFNGSDSFTYAVSDGNGGTDTATVTLTVDPVNDDPVADDDGFGVAAGETLAVDAALGVLNGDVDVDGDTLSASLVSDVSNGSLTLNADGSFEYIPDAGFSGTDSFTYVANDGTTDSNIATATIAVAPPEVPVVSFEVVPDAVSEEGSLEERTITFQYTVDGFVPEDGLSVLVSLDNLGDFTSQGLEVGPSNFINLEFGDGFFPELNAFELILTDQLGSFDVVLEDDLIQEEDVTVDFFELLSDTDGLLGTPYAVNPDSNIGTISITDGVDFLDGPVVSFTADTTDLFETQEVTLTFDVEGDIPEGGLTVVIGSTTGEAALEFDPAILGVTPPGFAGPPVVTASNVLLTLLDPDASITLELAEDGIPEGTETVNLFLEDGELYEVDPANGSIDLSVSDVPLVSFEVVPDAVSEEGSLEERTITFQYTVDGFVPEDGLSVLVSLDNLGDFTSQGLEVGPSNFINLEFGDGFFPELNAFELILTDQIGSFDVVLEDDLIQEEDVTVDFFELLSDTDGLLDNPYNIDPDSNIGTISITDGVDFPDGPVVGFTVDRADVVEGEEITVSFNVEGEIPIGGLTVVVGSDTPAAALEFDPSILLDPGSVDGIIFPPSVTADSVLLTLTEATASISLIVADDGLVEGIEDITFSLLDGELYELDPDASEFTLSIADADVVGGTDGRDILSGTTDNDNIIGGDNRDILSGNGGNDRFTFTSFADRIDLITDFTTFDNAAEADLIDLGGLLDSIGFDGEDPFADGFVRVVDGLGSRDSIQVDLDGAEGPDVFRTYLQVVNDNANFDNLNNAANFVF
ncbi:tandem-95 repeat protein [Synechococcus sp. PCC 7336]|uniref:tandem-95 repeat protein n=1 Tax=Synechococcus sp. PCC 7336 TaxID=195250 RepID=UPI001D0D129C|nr:tandem-95 repeat protein [Synechococcus sp. PCC 7336]